MKKTSNRLWAGTLWVLVAVAALTLTNCKGKNGNTAPGVTNFATKTESQWNGAVIKGTVTNMSDAKISYVEVQYQLTDKKMFPIQTVSVSSDQGIAPNGTWDFEIPASNVQAKGTRLVQTIVK